ncbi:MAG: SPOR domain-containing protein [Paludibacteraceae bacterium]|nr:SPOR domain-containing protein [Paludibacteraceae bacterium]
MTRKMLIGAILCCWGVVCVHAENQTDSIVPYQRPAIFEEITDNTHGGNVTLYQDERIETVIASKINGSELQTMDISGFRLQVYSSNVPQTSKKEAFDIEKDMKTAFPDIPVYVIYQPPFWKVRLGDFRNQTEADLLRQDVITRFPNIKGDVYLVKDMIQVAK